jgi:hypothetical protein
MQPSFGRELPCEYYREGQSVRLPCCRIICCDAEKPKLGHEPLRAFRASADEARVAEYEAGRYKGFGEEVLKAFAVIVPVDAEPSGVADQIIKVVDIPFGKRPFRIHYDQTEDGANVGLTVLDRLRAEMLHRIGLSELLKPSVLV